MVSSIKIAIDKKLEKMFRIDTDFRLLKNFSVSLCRLKNINKSFSTALNTLIVSLFMLTASCSTNSSAQALPTCVHIASYAPGYSWQDEIDRSIQKQLKQTCQLTTFYMDSKKVTEEKPLQALGLEAKRFIEQRAPEVVIVSDDNAVKYVLQAHFRNHSLPFVFCGINNRAKSYGLPYSNTTGMTEVSPIRQAYNLFFNLNSGQTHIAYLGTHGKTVSKNIEEFHRFAKETGTKSSTYRTHNQTDWRTIYKQLQEDPDVQLIILDGYQTLPEWNHQLNLKWVKQHSQKPSLTMTTSMMPYASLGLLKSADEQGWWAGLAAKSILNGTPVNRIATVPNKKFQLWINPNLSILAKQKIPVHIESQAIIYSEPL